jgi:hypothetical protein
MAPVTRSLIRNVGTPSPVSWSGAPDLGYARVRSLSAGTFSGITGANTFGVKLDGAAAIVVTPSGSEANFTDLQATIEGTSGLAGKAFVVSGNRLEIRSTTSVEITGLSNTSSEKLGLVNVAAATAAQESIAVPPEPYGDEIELLSDLITVPNGANVMALDLQLRTSGSQARGILTLTPCWETAFWPSEDDDPLTIHDYPPATMIVGSPAARTTDAPLAAQRIGPGAIEVPLYVGNATRVRMTPVIEIPPHRTGFRLRIDGLELEGGGFPANAPKLWAYASFGVR